MEMEIIHKSGFFKAFVEEYVTHFGYRHGSRLRVIYALCNTVEEKIAATLEEKTRIKNRIKELGNEDISWIFLLEYRRATPVKGFEIHNDNLYWLNFFNAFIPYRIPSFTPYSNYGLITGEYGGKEYPYRVITVGGSLERIDGNSLNHAFIIKCEKEIMAEIETIIDTHRKYKVWDIDIDFLELYINRNTALKQLFNLCELLSQVFLLRETEKFLSEEITEESDYFNDNLPDSFVKYGFFDLPKIKNIPSDKHSKLLDLIRLKDAPYVIALFDHLGFITHLEKEHFKTKSDMHKEISQWLKCSPRNIKGQINVLSDYTTEDKKRYTSYKHKEEVGKDVQSLK